jgi:hypothetical protein
MGRRIVFIAMGKIAMNSQKKSGITIIHAGVDVDGSGSYWLLWKPGPDYYYWKSVDIAYCGTMPHGALSKTVNSFASNFGGNCDDALWPPVR